MFGRQGASGADGKPLALPQEALGLMVLNIHSYGGARGSEIFTEWF